MKSGREFVRRGDEAGGIRRWRTAALASGVLACAAAVAAEAQIAAKAEAMQAAVAIDQTLSRMTLALVDPISYSLIGVVVAWAAFLFCGYGLMSKRHPMSYLVLVIGRLGRSVRDLHHRRFDQSFFGGHRGQQCAAGRCPEGRRVGCGAGGRSPVG
jgi:hypothetical protein